MAKSQLLVPGAYVWLNGATAHRTWSAEKPIAPATAYATALSKPFPVAGSFNFHCDPLAAPPWKYGGYAGLSVPTMSAPGLTYVVTPFAQSAAVRRRRGCRSTGPGSRTHTLLRAIQGRPTQRGPSAPSTPSFPRLPGEEPGRQD